MKPIRYVVIALLYVIVLFTPIGGWQTTATIAIADTGVMQVTEVSGKYTTETFTLSPEWVERGVRCMIITEQDGEPMELAQTIVSLPEIKIAGISFHRVNERVDSVVIFFTLDPTYQPPPVGFREGEKTIRELIDEMAQ